MYGSGRSGQSPVLSALGLALVQIAGAGKRDVEGTGFALGAIEVILDEAAEGAPNDPLDGAEDEIPLVRDAAVSRSGDVWRAGRHRLVCGDARD